MHSPSRENGVATRETVAGLVGELSALSALALSTDALDRVVWEAAMLAVLRSPAG